MSYGNMNLQFQVMETTAKSCVFAKTSEVKPTITEAVAVTMSRAEVTGKETPQESVVCFVVFLSIKFSFLFTLGDLLCI